MFYYIIMGVKGLISLLQDYPEVCNYVSIEKLANDHKRSSGCSPVLVVDGSNFIPSLYTSGKYPLGCIYGGQWIEFREVLERFVSKFKSKGIQLVFIFDGTICEEKLKEWINRRTIRYDEISAIFDDISKNFQEKVITSELVSPSLKLLAKYALKEMNVDIYQTDKQVEADNYIANYANENEAVFAILSDDSDFIIFDTKPLLSTSQLSLKKFETVMYDRDFIAKRYLKIEPSLLPLFACLMGNDYVRFDSLKRFHHRLAHNEKPFKVAKVKNLCKLIKQEKWTGDFTNRRELSSITYEVFGHGKSSDLIKRGLESYVIDKAANPLSPRLDMSPEFIKVAHERHFKSSNSYIYNLLCKMEYGSSEVFEDGSMAPSALVYREIRQRCYGLLFNCFVDPNNVISVVIEERCWYKKNQNENNNLNEPERIKPLPLCNISDVKKVEELWFNSTDKRRFEFFWHILQIPMEFDLLMKLPEDQVTLSCILNYLISRRKSGPLLEPLDVAVFVAQAVWQPSAEDIEQLENPKVCALAVNLSSLFMSGIEAILMALETCGFTSPYKYALPWRFFDGKLFHFLYEKAKRRPRVRILCNNEDEVIERFYQLLPIVTDNTDYDVSIFDWSDILKDFSV